jgi:MFS family permease
MEAFPTTTTGLVMSMFYVGFLGGCIHVDRLVAHVGHVRTFGVLASIASAAVLVHAVFVDPVAWGFLRLASGYCFAGLYVVAESWLNARATNETRGQLLSIYMIVTYLGVGGGQLLLNTASPLGCELFILTSVLISLALVPLLMSAGPTGSVRQSTRVSLRELMRLSPLGTAGAFAVGITSGKLFSTGPVYAGTAGLSVADTSLFMAAAVTGTIILQWPIGRSSDVFDRRKVIALVTFAAAGVALGPVDLW